MSVLPRWNDDFSTDPTSDPAYSTTVGITYDGVNDLVEFGKNNTAGEYITILNSNNTYGVAEFDLYYESPTNVPGRDHIAVRAFGYWFVSGLVSSYGSPCPFKGVYPEEIEPFDLICSGSETLVYVHGEGSLFQIQQNAPFHGHFTLKIISTPNGVDFYIDNILLLTAPPRVAIGDIRVQSSVSTNSTKTNDNNVSRISLISDGSLSKIPTITTPAIAGALENTNGPIIVDIPESRLYLDLGSYAGQITGLSNVVYDPGGTPVAMAEDVGIPDGAGGTIGDFYLEIPNRTVSSDYRLILKEDFVTTNSVSTGDDIDFDVDDGPAGQNALIKEEDDLHCIVTKSLKQGFIDRYYSLNVFEPNPVVININADGNAGNYAAGDPDTFFDGDFDQYAIQVRMANPVFPIIVDVDLGRIYKIKQLALPATENASQKNLMFWDIYSNTVSWTGANLGDGTLEYSKYPTHRQYGIQTTLADNIKGLQRVPGGPELNFSTRYLRFVVGDNTTAYWENQGALSSVYLGYEIDVRVEQNISINSSDDNAQFEHEPAAGGGFVAFPAGGVTQQDGQVRVTLTSDMEISNNQENYLKISFKSDLTD